MRQFRAALIAIGLFAVLEIKGDETPARPVSAPAKIRIPDCRIVLIDQATLACDRTGILKSIDCKEGSRVTAKQVVAVVADDVARANLAVAEKKAKNDVEVRYNRKASEIATLEYNKSSEANKKAASSGTGLIPVAVMEVQKLKLAAEKATLGIEQAELELELNRLNAAVTRAELATYSVVADFDGVVTRVFKKRGEAIRQGDPIVEIINPSRVRIEGRVGLSNLPFTQEGCKVKVRLFLPDVELPEENELFDGQITFVDRVSDPVTHTTRIIAEVQNRNNILRAGLMAEMILETSSK